ncbi:DNA photolyase, putative [Bodo saltans]|uniref:DNA photolyase, putative n=2 Tax=Bodo saltans TaxID=75058 RepID=A0A0S4IZG6_BODSA|nr:DNA photolyase, putative [Bodo saltans]|eukprot:CUG26768.1 DNA photolyase, putative [Bodo saltans]
MALRRTQLLWWASSSSRRLTRHLHNNPNNVFSLQDTVAIDDGIIHHFDSPPMSHVVTPPAFPQPMGSSVSTDDEVMMQSASSVVAHATTEVAVTRRHAAQQRSTKALAAFHQRQLGILELWKSLPPLAAGYPAESSVGVCYWLNDLRVHDHYPLALACRRAKETGGVPVVAMMCLDPRCFAQPSQILGCYRMGPERAKFTLECIASLRGELGALGVPLVIRIGLPEVILPTLFAQLRCHHVYTTTQYAPHEKVIHDSLLQLTAAQVHSVWHTTLVHVDDLPTPLASMRTGFRWFHDDAVMATIRPTKPYDCSDALKELPSVLPFFQAFDEDNGRTTRSTTHNSKLKTHNPSHQRAVGETSISEEGMGALPTMADLGYGSYVPELAVTHVIATSSSHHGGERSATQRLEEWLEQGGMKRMVKLGVVKRPTVDMYATNLLRISPYLSTGCMSPRRLYERLREYAYDNVMDGSSQSQFQEAMLRLFRRDYFHFQGLLHGNSMFYSYGPTPENTDEAPDWRYDDKLLRRWCNGLTGFPFADAAMRELLATGWVGAPGRQALMWLLSIGLEQDWRAGAEWFERCSLDFDPFVCYGNAAYYSKLTPDDYDDAVHTHHYLAGMHDQTGIYIKKWLPQLSKVPSVYIHRPHVMSERMQEMHGVFLGKTYPYPIKLWDGAQSTMGPSQLTAYFETAEQRRSRGPMEALEFSRDKMAPLSSLHLTTGPQRYRNVASAMLHISENMEVDDDENVLVPASRQLKDDAMHLATMAHSINN